MEIRPYRSQVKATPVISADQATPDLTKGAQLQMYGNVVESGGKAAAQIYDAVEKRKAQDDAFAYQAFCQQVDDVYQNKINPNLKKYTDETAKNPYKVYSQDRDDIDQVYNYEIQSARREVLDNIKDPKMRAKVELYFNARKLEAGAALANTIEQHKRNANATVINRSIDNGYLRAANAPDEDTLNAEIRGLVSYVDQSVDLGVIEPIKRDGVVKEVKGKALMTWASNTVRNIASDGGYDPAKKFIDDQVKAEYEHQGIVFTQEDIDKLNKVASGEVSRVNAAYTEQGTNEMAQAIEAGNAEDYYKTQQDRTDISPAYKQAILNGAGQAQLNFAVRLSTDYTRDMGTMTLGELRQKRNDWVNERPGMMGSPQSEEQYAKTLAAFDKAIEAQEKALEDAGIKAGAKYVDDWEKRQKAFLNTFIPELKAGRVSGYDVMKAAENVTAGAETEYASGRVTSIARDNVTALASKIIADIIPTVKPEYKGYIEDCQKHIKAKLFDRWGVKKEDELSDEQQREYNDAKAYAEGAIIDLILESRNLTTEQLLNKVDDIQAVYDMKTYSMLTRETTQGIYTDNVQSALDILQDHSDSKAVFYDDKTGNFEFASNKVKKSFNEAADNVAEWITDVYGEQVIKDKPVEYQGKIVPSFKAAFNPDIQYIVYDGQVLKMYSDKEGEGKRPIIHLDMTMRRPEEKLYILDDDGQEHPALSRTTLREGKYLEQIGRSNPTGKRGR